MTFDVRPAMTPRVTPGMPWGNPSPDAAAATWEFMLRPVDPTPRNLAMCRQLAETYRRIGHQARHATVVTMSELVWQTRSLNAIEAEAVEARLVVIDELTAEMQRLALHMKQSYDVADGYNALLIEMTRP